MNNSYRRKINKYAILLLLCIIIMAIETLWCDFLWNNMGELLEALYNAMEIKIVNISTTVLILVIAYTIIWETFRRREFSIYLYFALGIFIYEFWFGKYWLYASTPIPSVDYGDFIGFLLFFYLIVHTIAHITKDDTSSSKSGSIENGFTVDTEDDDKVEVGWKKYCGTLVEKLIDTDLSKESFVVGVSGTWGSGKTTFLKTMRPLLKDKFKVVEFNPWTCQNASQIVDDFFKTLEESMDDESLSLKDSLNDYAAALDGIEALPWLSKVLHTLGKKPQRTLAKLKNSVNKNVLASGKKYAVLIDDIDRLDADEVLEVLRLVRISANFANIVFIVAYDSRYVIGMLNEKGIKNGEEYIRKMFQLEIALPGFETYKIPQMLYKELEGKILDKKVFESLKSAIVAVMGNRYIVSQHLTNFRDVKRFANIFVLNYQQMCNTLQDGEFNIYDLFWLELLHYSDPYIYTILRDEQNILLEPKFTNSSIVYYVTKDKFKRNGTNITNKSVEKSEKNLLGRNIQEEKDIRISAVTADILSILFESTSDESLNKLRYEENYLRYFSYRLPENKISPIEFEKFISEVSTEVGIDMQIQTWCHFSPIKYEAIVKRISFYEPKGRSLIEQKQFILFMVSMVKYVQPNVLSGLFALKLFRGLYHTDDINNLQTYLFDLCREAISKAKYLYTWLFILVEMYPVEDMDDEGVISSVEPNTILKEEQLKTLLELQLQRIIDENTPITDITKENTPLAFAMRNATKTVLSVKGEEHTTEECLLLDAVTKMFSGKKSKEFDKFIKPIKQSVDWDYVNDAEAAEFMRGKLWKLFGNRYAYKKFINACFDVEKEKIEAHYSELGI